MKNNSTLLGVLAALTLTIIVPGSKTIIADTPLGWINSANTSAYTTTQGDFELSLGKLAVNDTLDIFDYRKEILKASGSLEGDSGNFSGSKIEASYGVTQDFSLFYRRQSQDLTLDLGEISSVDLIDIDDALETLVETLGFKWTFFRANLLNSDNRQSAASIELAGFRSESNDFDAVLSQIRLENLTISFGIPQTFSVASLEDEGWKGRLIYSFPFSGVAVASFWAGYGESEATSGTTSDLQSATLRRFFDQDFELEEEYLYLGASLSTQLTPRLSLNVNYEYINVTESSLERFPLEPLPDLPGFLSSGALSEVDNNHTLSARIGYWLTPEINLSLTGNLYANQFVGVLPHYNNPLSGSFSATPYGFAGIELLYNFSIFR